MFIFNFSQLLIFRKSSQERIGKAHRPWINYYVFVRETLLDLGKKKKKIQYNAASNETFCRQTLR